MELATQIDDKNCFFHKTIITSGTINEMNRDDDGAPIKGMKDSFIL